MSHTHVTWKANILCWFFYCGIIDSNQEKCSVLSAKYKSARKSNNMSAVLLEKPSKCDMSRIMKIFCTPTGWDCIQP